MEYRIDKLSVDVNFPITDEEFAIEIPEGAKVTDDRKGKASRQYKASDNGILSLGKGGLDLEKMDWLMPLGKFGIPRAEWDIRRIVCLNIGILLVLWGIYRYFFRKA